VTEGDIYECVVIYNNENGNSINIVICFKVARVEVDGGCSKACIVDNHTCITHFDGSDSIDDVATMDNLPQANNSPNNPNLLALPPSAFVSTVVN